MHIVLLLFFTHLFGMQAPDIQGTYKYSGKTNKEPYGLINIHYSNPSTVLFYFEAGRGAPSYNSGAMYGMLTLNSKTNTYEYKPTESYGCKLQVIKQNNKVVIKTVSGDCGFGNGVSADGTYNLIDKRNPLSCTTRTGKKVYFDKTQPATFSED